MAERSTITLIFSNPQNLLFDSVLHEMRYSQHQAGMFSLLNAINRTEVDPIVDVKRLLESTAECNYVWSSYATSPNKLKGLSIASVYKLHEILATF